MRRVAGSMRRDIGSLLVTTFCLGVTAMTFRPHGYRAGRTFDSSIDRRVVAGELRAGSNDAK
jgi:hypothetical protein